MTVTNSRKFDFDDYSTEELRLLLKLTKQSLRQRLDKESATEEVQEKHSKDDKTEEIAANSDADSDSGEDKGSQTKKRGVHRHYHRHDHSRHFKTRGEFAENGEGKPFRSHHHHHHHHDRDSGSRRFAAEEERPGPFRYGHHHVPRHWGFGAETAGEGAPDFAGPRCGRRGGFRAEYGRFGARADDDVPSFHPRPPFGFRHQGEHFGPWGHPHPPPPPPPPPMDFGGRGGFGGEYGAFGGFGGDRRNHFMRGFGGPAGFGGRDHTMRGFGGPRGFGGFARPPPPPFPPRHHHEFAQYGGFHDEDLGHWAHPAYRQGRERDHEWEFIPSDDDELETASETSDEKEI